MKALLSAFFERAAQLYERLADRLSDLEDRIIMGREVAA